MKPLRKAKYYIFASDPHGTGIPWIKLVQAAQAAYPDAQTVFGGDYIDGREYSLETVRFIEDQVQAGARALIGNHEKLMFDFVQLDSRLWYVNGGKTTVRSFLGRGYGAETVRRRLYRSRHYRFLIGLPTMLVTEHLCFVHAGLTRQELAGNAVLRDYANFKLDLDWETHLWARQNYWYQDNDDVIFAHNHSRHTIISGHTPTMLLSGSFDQPTRYCPEQAILPTYNYNHPEQDDLGRRPCPVRVVRYNDEPGRYFTDDGCHGGGEHFGNVCVFDDYGNLVETFNQDPKETAYTPTKEDS